jgi:hypothetical protein
MRDAPEVDWVVAAPVVLMVVLGGFGCFRHHDVRGLSW